MLCSLSYGAFADTAADLKNAADLIAAKKYNEAIKLLGGIQSADPALVPQTLEMIGDCYRLKLYFPEAARAYEADLSRYKLPDEQAKRIRRWLIKCHIRGREWAKVEQEIDAVATESPECGAWSYYALGAYYQRFRGYPKAIAAYTRAMPSDKTVPAPDPKLVQTALVDCYTGAHQWDKATELLKKMAVQYPAEAAHWHADAGAIYEGQKKYAQAIAEFKQAIDAPAALDARQRLGNCYRDTLSAAAAAPLIMEIVEKHPKDGPYLPTMAGQFYQGLKQYDKAIAAYKLLIENCPDARWQVWDACYYIGECCYAQGKGKEALTYIKDFYAKHPDRPMDFALAYGKTLLYPAQNPAEAAEVLAKAVAEHPTAPLVSEVRSMLLAAYIDSKQIVSLADVLNSLLGNAPASEKAGLLLALVDHYVTARKFREAASMCRGVLALRDSTEDARAHAAYQLGVCYHNSNMDAAARQAMHNVAKRHPGSDGAKKARGTLYVWDTDTLPKNEGK